MNSKILYRCKVIFLAAIIVSGILIGCIGCEKHESGASSNEQIQQPIVDNSSDQDTSPELPSDNSVNNDDLASENIREDSEPVQGVSVAILGNSMIESLAIYHTIPEADLFYKIGLNVSTVYTKNCVNCTGPAIEELSKKPYEVVVLVFGMNELGWSESGFISGYASVIDSVKQYQPDARIYLHSITPVSNEVSEANQHGMSNIKIKEYNTAIQQLAEDKNVLYLNADPVFYATDGALLVDASADGIHPEILYTKKWTTLLRQYIKGEIL